MDVSPIVVQLLITAEDRRYQFHPGVDPLALCRALWHTLALQKCEGGSTIAMQLVRVITGRYERTLYRKILEIFLAVKLSCTIPKAQLRQALLGGGLLRLANEWCQASVQTIGCGPDKGQRRLVDRSRTAPLSLVIAMQCRPLIKICFAEPRQPSKKRITQINVPIRYILLTLLFSIRGKWVQPQREI